MKRIAFYGKGGIGKSTVAVNAALSMAHNNSKVKLIGCDPKQDTTRLLGGEIKSSLIDVYDELLERKGKLDDLIVFHPYGVQGLEVGGPKPGVGCAGRGIMLVLDFLSKQQFFFDTDVILFDVLGDVVCGGFASPVSKHYTDEVVIVTSGQPASLFAANNIIGGISNVGGYIRGIVGNLKGFEGESQVIQKFSDKVNLPILGIVNHSNRIHAWEIKKKAIVEAEPESSEAYQFSRLAEELLKGELPETQSQPFGIEEFYSYIDEIWSESFDESVIT